MTPYVNNFAQEKRSGGGRGREWWLVGGCRLEVDGDGIVVWVVACPRAYVNRWIQS